MLLRQHIDRTAEKRDIAQQELDKIARITSLYSDVRWCQYKHASRFSSMLAAPDCDIVEFDEDGAAHHYDISGPYIIIMADPVVITPHGDRVHLTNSPIDIGEYYDHDSDFEPKDNWMKNHPNLPQNIITRIQQHIDKLKHPFANDVDDTIDEDGISPLDIC